MNDLNLIRRRSLELRVGHAPLQELVLPGMEHNGIRLVMMRGDLVHPVISGNKWWKLKYSLLEAVRLELERLVTFGGAYSNHLLAVAYAAKALGFAATGLVRGEEHLDSPLLQQCRDLGMELCQVSRSDYRNKTGLLQKFDLDQKPFCVLPEGGSNLLALEGCAEVVPGGFSHVLVPVGTGGTLAGLALGAHRLGNGCRVEGISVLKGGGFLAEEITRFIPQLNNWKLHLEYHGGGYGKISPQLLEFIAWFRRVTGIGLEPIYTGKMIQATLDLIARDHFPPGSTVLCVHTGGLGGWVGQP